MFTYFFFIKRTNHLTSKVLPQIKAITYIQFNSKLSRKLIFPPFTIYKTLKKLSQILPKLITNKNQYVIEILILFSYHKAL